MKKIALFLAIVMSLLSFSLVLANDNLRATSEEDVLLIAPAEPKEEVKEEENVDAGPAVVTEGEVVAEPTEETPATDPVPEDTTPVAEEPTANNTTNSPVVVEEAPKSNSTIIGAIIAIVIVVVVVAIAALIQKK